MNEVLQRRFAAMGARVELRGRPLGMPSIDVSGRRFVIRFPGDGERVDVEAVDVRGRHLLLLVRNGETKSKFLCGHDERHWFVAAIPEGVRGVSGVAAAISALKPEGAQGTPHVRQGEWFFVPEPRLQVQDWYVLRNEPIRRGNGKPPIVQFIFRRGGETVYVSSRHPNGLSQAEFDRLSERYRDEQQWEVMVRDAEVFGKGTVRHPDHATIRLRGWHRVLMNTEHRAHAMRHVAFLD